MVAAGEKASAQNSISKHQQCASGQQRWHLNSASRKKRLGTLNARASGI